MSYHHRQVAKDKESNWVRKFTVSNPVEHEKGYTIYQITLKKFHTREFDMKPQVVVVWKRYNAVKKLYSFLFNYHQRLFQKDPFPQFAKSKVFGRFESSVIEERIRSTETLLNFVGSHYHLFSHPRFVQFMQTSERPPESALSSVTTTSVDEQKPTSKFEILQPTTSIVSETGSTTTTTSDLPDFEGSLEERRLSLETQLANLQPITTTQLPLDEDETEELPKDDETVDSDQWEDISDFDPYKITPKTTPTISKESNSWLLNAMTLCAALEEADSNDQPDTSTDEPDGLNEPDIGSETAENETVSSASQIHSSSSGYKSEDIGGSSAVREVVSDKAKTDEAAKTKRTNLEKFLDKLPNVFQRQTSSGGVRDQVAEYIYSSANMICEANEFEMSGEFAEAFQLYKQAIGRLLEGVQTDSDKCRREAVRRKTAYYLMRAEQLYNQHLTPQQSDTDAIRRWEPGIRSLGHLPSELSSLRGSHSELFKLTVVAVTGRVMVVMDRVTCRRYALKVLPKTAMRSTTPPDTLVPTRSPYMVPLYRFFETDNNLYLLLHLISGGRLWDFCQGPIS